MEFNAAEPIYLQVIEDIKKRIVTEELALGEKLPSVRDLAIQYKINPNTASRIYKEMETQNLCYTKRGLGTFITESGEMKEQIRNEMASNYVKKFVFHMKGLGYDANKMIKQVKDELNKEELENA